MRNSSILNKLRETFAVVSALEVRCRLIWLPFVLCTLLSAHAATTISITDTVVAPKSPMGVNVGSASANIIDGSCFEAAADSNGFASEGWGWYKGSGTYTASVDTSTFQSGKQSQKIVVTAGPAEMKQTQVDLPQAALTRQMTPSSSIVIKAHIKSSSSSARVQFGVVDGGWATHYSSNITVTNGWATYSFTFVPTVTDIFRGISISFQDNTTYWVDDVIAYDANNTDPDTGLVKTYVDRLKELKPAMLRLGGLGVNGIPLEKYLFQPWTLSYGPPPNEYYNINTFMTLCKVTGSNAFICVPPAFTDTASAATQTDLTVDLVDNHYADHGNIVDYLGGDSTTVYGARRQADGYSRWDTQVGAIYYEMGNETWGTPDGLWDMHLGLPGDPWMQTYATYCTKRMTEMKGRTGWRSNMRVGFGGFVADADSWAHYSTILIPALKGLTDFGTINMYYGSGDNTMTDEQIYGGLYAKAQWFQRTIGNMNSTYNTANGGPLECVIYEGNCVWGNYYNGPAANDQFVYGKEVSAGAAVSLVDSYSAGNAAGVSYNCHFAFTGGSWSSLTAEPNYFRKPAYFALKMLNNYVSGNLVTATVSGEPTWNDGLTSEQNVPYVACYPYKNGSNFNIVLVNRHRTASQTVTINRPLTVSQLVTLTASNINANNETGETVTLQTQSATSAANSYTLTIPPFSAYVVVASDGISGTPPTVALTAPANNAKFNTGSNIVLTATAAATGGTISKVDFYAGTTLIGTDTSSPYSVTWNNAAAGVYALTAKATDSNNLTTTSSTINITVNAPPSVSITAPANNANFNTGSNITIGATASATGGTISKVDFYAGTTLLGTANASPYSFTWSNVAAGTYALTAKATDSNGQVTTSAALNITVKAPAPPPTVSLTAPANNATFTAGANIALTASATATGGTISKVDFYAGTTLLGTSTTSPYSFTWNNVAAGSYVLTAKATDSNSKSTTSTAVNIIVNAAGSTPPTVALTSPANNATFATGANITLTATASAASGASISKVEFYADSTLLGTSTAAPYSFTWNNVTAGSYSLTAKATDSKNAAAVSSTANIVVSTTSGGGTPEPAPVMSSGLNVSGTVTVGVPATFTVGASDPDGDVLTYTWTFGDGSTTTGTDASTSHVYTSPGNFTASVTISDGKGGTTLSSFPVTVSASAPPVPLPVNRLAGAAKFILTGHDVFSIMGTIPYLPSGFSADKQAVVLTLGGAQVSFTLDVHGKARTKQGTFALKFPPVKHVKKTKSVFVGGAVAFQCAVKGDFAHAWEQNGMDPATAKSTLNLVVTLTFNGVNYASSIPVNYKGKPHVNGHFTK